MHVDSGVLLEPFLRQRSMLSVMVILLSEMNSYRMRVAIAVFSPSSAPCLVFALKTEQRILTFILAAAAAGGAMRGTRQVSPPFIHRAVDEPLQLVLEVLLGRVLAGFSTCRHTGLASTTAAKHGGVVHQTHLHRRHWRSR